MADTPAVSNTSAAPDAPAEAIPQSPAASARVPERTPVFKEPFVRDERAIGLVPREKASYGLLPVWCRDGVLGLAVIDGAESYARKALAELGITRYELFLMQEQVLTPLLREAYPTRKARVGDAVSVHDPKDPNFLLDSAFEEGYRLKASDIHFEPHAGGDGGGYRLRVHGVYESATPFPPNTYRAIANVLMTRAGMDPTNQRAPHDGRYRWPKHDIEMRTASIPVMDGEAQAITVRLFPKHGEIPTLDQVGMSDQLRRIYLNAANGPYGSIFITGPTGSGKTTTLYSTLKSLDYLHRKVITIEDPVEMRLPPPIAQQVGVNYGAGLTFASFLKNAVRHDPNVVMVGEIRDPDTAQAAMNAALIGLLMLSTLHAPDALRTITRLIELGVAPGTLADASTLFVGQRLVRRLCDECKRAEATPQTMLMEYPNAPEHVFAAGGTDASGAGCPACHGLGYTGRLGVFELVVNTPDVARAIRAQASAVELRDIAATHGYRPMRQDAMDRVAAGVTSWFEVERVLLSERLGS